MRFAADASLGKLGRYLRSAGFDTLIQHQSRQTDFFNTIGPDRLVLTRTTALKVRFRGRPLVFIRGNDPLQQMVQVVRELGIRLSDTRPFSRCLACNGDISRTDREMVKSQVPAYVWQHHQTFHACRQCRRIYWSGSHHDRMREQLIDIFQQKEDQTHAC